MTEKPNELPYYEETYRGRRIRIQEPKNLNGTGHVEPLEMPQLSIDDVPVNVVQTPGGNFIADSYAYDPAPSVLDLARRMIDVLSRGGAAET